MSNEVTPLLNKLNSFISCRNCKGANEIEIILRCGHVICKVCKTKRTRCPSCYSDILVTRKHSPSVKFIEELREELLKKSVDLFPDVISVLTENIGKNAPNEDNNSGLLFEKCKENFSGTDSDKVGKSNSDILAVQLLDNSLNDSVKQTKGIETIIPNKEQSIIKEIKKNTGNFSENNTTCKMVEKGCPLSVPVDSNVDNRNSTVEGKNIGEHSENKNSTCETRVVNKTSYVIHDEITDADDDVIILDETRTEQNLKKNDKHKKKIMYGNFIKEGTADANKKILHDLGIVGIDRKIQNGESKLSINGSKTEWDGQLNSIISRLNSGNPKDEKEISKDNVPFSVMTNRDNSIMLQEIKSDDIALLKTSPNKSSFKFGKKPVDLKRKTHDSIESYSHLCCKQRKKNETEKNVEVVFNKLEHDLKAISNSGNSDKKLGGIVDDTELVQRYLNATMKDIPKYIGNQTEKSHGLGVVSSKQLNNSKSKGLDLLNELSVPCVNITSSSCVTNNSIVKSDKVETISDFSPDPSRNLADDELRTDIIADMLNNVSNEIIVVGSKLCAAEKPFTANCSGSYSNGVAARTANSHKPNKTSPKPSVDQHLLDSKDHLNDGKDKKSRNCDTIMIFDSDDESKAAKNNSISNSQQTKTNQPLINFEKEVNIKNCKVVIENFAPEMFMSLDSNIKVNNYKLINKKTSPLLKKSSDTVVSPKNIQIKKGKPQAGSSKRNGLSKKSIDKCKEEINNFEGFTEQDILILTVKLALFKMNGNKYFDNLSSSSLFSLDGKQILIKDLSQEQEEQHTTGSCASQNTSSDVAVEISDSEDESYKELVSSSVQTENDVSAVTPSPSTSRIRPVSIAKLRGLERANEKFMQNDILDTREPLTPDASLQQEAMPSPLSSSSPVQRLTPVSRRQLSFMSPSFERTSQVQDNGAIASHSKEMERGYDNSSGDDWQVLHYRMKYLIPSYNEETSHDEFERSGVRPTRLTFTTCGLNTKETALVTKLAQMTKSCLTKDFTHDTTHLIIGATGRGTLEYYLAIAYRAFIVTIEWVSLCIALNKILPVTGFIPTEHEGPLKCLEPISPPFVGFYICSKILPRAAGNYPIAEITKTLLSLGGARLLSDIDAFLTLQDGNYPRFVVFEADSQITQAVIDKCASMRIVPLQFMWVYESISAFRALPVMDFLGTVIHSRTLIRDYKVPEQLACSRFPRLEGEFRPQILDERYQRSL